MASPTVETHTFGSSAASQFLVAASYFAPIFEAKNPSQALSAFPTVLNFNVPGTFTNLGGGDNIDVFGFGRSNTQYQISEDVVKTVGRSKLGFGANPSENTLERATSQIEHNCECTDARQSLDAFYQGGIDPATPNTDFTQLTQSFTSEAFLRASLS